MMESIEKLRKSSHLDDEKWTLSDGRVMWISNGEPNDPNAVNWGEHWRKIADEIEREIAERYMMLPVDADGVPIHCDERGEKAEATCANPCAVGFSCSECGATCGGFPLVGAMGVPWRYCPACGAKVVEP